MLLCPMILGFSAVYFCFDIFTRLTIFVLPPLNGATRKPGALNVLLLEIIVVSYAQDCGNIRQARQCLDSHGQAKTDSDYNCYLTRRHG